MANTAGFHRQDGKAITPLPLHMLASVVGGAGVEKKPELTPDRAAALTVGGPADAPGAAHPQAEVKAAAPKVEPKVEPKAEPKPEAQAEAAQPGLLSLADLPSAAKIAAENRSQFRVEAKDSGGGLTKPTWLKAETQSLDLSALKPKDPYERHIEATNTAIKNADKAQSELNTAKTEHQEASQAALAHNQTVSAKTAETEKADGQVKAATEAVKTARDVESAAKAKVDGVQNDIAKAKDRVGTGDRSEAKGHDEPQSTKARSNSVDAASSQKTGPKVEAWHAERLPAVQKDLAAKADNTARQQGELTKATAEHTAAKKAEGTARDEQATQRADLAKKIGAVEAKTEGAAGAGAKADVLKAVDTKSKVDDATQKKDREAVGNLVKDKGWEKGVGVFNTARMDAVRDLAKSDGEYHKSEGSSVSGGVRVSAHDVHTVDGSTIETKTEKLGQITTSTKAEDFEAGGLKGGSAHTRSADMILEAGHKSTTTVTDAAGKTTVQEEKAYAAVNLGAKASVELTATHVAIEASAKVSGHAEIGHTTKDQILGADHVHTVSASVHGEAALKAGASLGFDGVHASVCAKAEVIAKACDAHTVKVGDVAIKNELEVFAQAKAEAKASADVNFNPFGDKPLGAKASLSCEASAGVGIKDTVSINDNLAVGGGLYAGKIGAKVDADVGFKDGKLSVALDLGASLGVGVSLNLKVNADFASTAKKAADSIRSGNFVEKAAGVASFLPPVFLFRSIFG